MGICIFTSRDVTIAQRSAMTPRHLSFVFKTFGFGNTYVLRNVSFLKFKFRKIRETNTVYQDGNRQ